MTVLSKLKRIFTAKGEVADKPFDPERFIYLMILDSVGPVDRGAKYEDPLDQMLRNKSLGLVSGGGSQLGEKDENGRNTIAYCGVDLEAANRLGTLELLREQLPLLGVPEGSAIHYTQNSVRLQDEYRSGHWLVGQPREQLHPYFEC